MGQFTKYLEAGFGPPPRVARAVQVVVPLAWVGKAIATHTLENIVAAALFVVLMLPAAIAPKAVHTQLTAWERDRPFLSDVFGCLLMTCATFVPASWLLDRTPSVLIAIAVGLVALIAGRLRRRRRTSSPQ